MENNAELQSLYSSALDTSRRHIGMPPPYALFNPREWVKKWVNDHPEKAQALAYDLYQDLHQYFESRGH